MGLGVTDPYKIDISILSFRIFIEYYSLVYPIGIIIFPIGYSIFPIGYSLFPVGYSLFPIGLL